MDVARQARGRRRAAATAALALLVALALAPGSARAAGPPNILHILTDDQTIDSMRYMPITERRLGDWGTTFTNYHATQPLCCPSRASFLTGQYPHNHGVLDNQPPYGYAAMDFSRTIYTSLQGAGYRTGWIGKVLNGVNDEGLVPAPGFDDWLVPLRNTEHDMFDYALSDNGVELAYSGVYQSDVYADRARRFLAESGSQPFLLTLSLFSPHWNFCPGSYERCPPAPAPEDLGSFAGERFPFGADFHGGPRQRAIADEYWQRELESMQSVDRIVGALVDQLRAEGELENTIIIFQSDNGFEHGEHGIFDKNVPWDRSVRVPLIIRGGGFRRGAVRSDLTANVDVPATIMDATGAAPPLPPDGYSLLSPHRRKVLLLERIRGRGASRLHQPWRQLKTARGWTYWRDLHTGRKHLYDLNRDPYQVHNRLRREPRLAHRLQRRMRRVASCADPCP